jgi:glycosyltransferase involved in cell wall biosynthesis
MTARLTPPRHARAIAAALLRGAAIATLGVLYAAAVLVSRARGRANPGSGRPSNCILVIGTFHNPNWFQSHVRPLARSGVGEVILVCDEVMAAAGKVRFECPPRWMAALLSRAGAKLVWALRCALRYRPDLYMGYHIFPAALSALVVARLFGRPACYQDTSGPLELEGGGWHAENRLLAALQRPSAWIERLAFAVVREFDSVVVRGSGAEAFIRRTGYRRALAVITGSVEPAGRWRDFSERTVDLAFVGRLTEYKRPDRFIAALAAVAKTLPRTRALVIGDGPDAQRLGALARELGVDANVQFVGKRADVNDLLATARVFLLTSRWEGLSIAMLEAMAAGAVPVVAAVGDLGDLLRDGENGFLVRQDDVTAFARQATALLSDPDLWRRCSRKAVATAVANSGVDAIAKRWQRHLRSVLRAWRAPGAATSTLEQRPRA